jgi:hypothetical protein
MSEKRKYEIEDLILQFLNDGLNKEEKIALDTWLAESTENKILFDELTNKNILHNKLVNFQHIESAKEQTKEKAIRKIISWNN